MFLNTPVMFALDIPRRWTNFITEILRGNKLTKLGKRGTARHWTNDEIGGAVQSRLCE